MSGRHLLLCGWMWWNIGTIHHITYISCCSKGPHLGELGSFSSVFSSPVSSLFLAQSFLCYFPYMFVHCIKGITLGSHVLCCISCMCVAL